MWLVVGLGNPGSEYAGTRHNAGFMVVQRLGQRWNLKFERRACSSRLTETRRGRTKIILALPQTFMNQSGLAVQSLLSTYKIKPENLLVIYDDLDLPLGEIRIRPQGSPGSHKGMKSIVEVLGTTLFPRVRLGIGPRPESVEAADYVLSQFSVDEKPKIKEAVEKACQAVEMIVAGRLAEAMNTFNRRQVDFLEK
ncbi:MAG TPA: aminoacyl-tRNA hydrolase [Candidatus Saccharicenans sp.]|nr:aminoacyl-tRNA hydrolase [Candidatus Saccharicenans sp.]HOL45459.1 aminoacyl-tRNA hydrolase [Candidatus Saccharicenans sp.]HOM94375.1 aminoacyl-tRNA hydrolase [Candidatus Saccharicenans sp.]HOT68900.1 aminoacyl-tRNA hydrolase [Candidatus Saccharicenans sp.]HPC88128.1 aminoacyl-tRNA hydrolase [Candidatus Saccharicenans sp.]